MGKTNQSDGDYINIESHQHDESQGDEVEEQEIQVDHEDDNTDGQSTMSQGERNIDYLSNFHSDETISSNNINQPIAAVISGDNSHLLDGSEADLSNGAIANPPSDQVAHGQIDEEEYNSEGDIVTQDVTEDGVEPSHELVVIHLSEIENVVEMKQKVQACQALPPRKRPSQVMIWFDAPFPGGRTTAKALVDYMQNCRPRKMLLGVTRMIDTDLLYLVNSLSSIPTIEHLALGLGHNTAILHRMFQNKACRIRKLDFHPSLDDNWAVKELSVALRSATLLQSINLKNCDLGQEFFSLIHLALRPCQDLREFSLELGAHNPEFKMDELLIMILRQHKRLKLVEVKDDTDSFTRFPLQIHITLQNEIMKHLSLEVFNYPLTVSETPKAISLLLFAASPKSSLGHLDLGALKVVKQKKDARVSVEFSGFVGSFCQNDLTCTFTFEISCLAYPIVLHFITFLL